MQSVPSLSTIVRTGDWVLVFSISSCVTDVPTSFKAQGNLLNGAICFNTFLINPHDQVN